MDLFIEVHGGKVAGRRDVFPLDQVDECGECPIGTFFKVGAASAGVLVETLFTESFHQQGD